MSQGRFLWRRGLFWPWFEVGREKALFGNLVFLYFLVGTPVSLYQSQVTSPQLWIIDSVLVYLFIGALLWVLAVGRYTWKHLATKNPKTTFMCSLVVLVVAWEFQVLFQKDTVPWLRDWWRILTVLTATSYVAMRLEYIRFSLGMSAFAVSEVLTLGTGLFLAYQKWQREKGGFIH
jgi:hypothetical protein